MDYNNRVFRGKSNSSNGEVSSQTKFYYRQSGDKIFADYSGGEITSGHLQGKVYPDGSLEFLYHHENVDGVLMAGICRSHPSFDASGKLTLNENWQWFTGDKSSGTSQIEEIEDEMFKDSHP